MNRRFKSQTGHDVVQKLRFDETTVRVESMKTGATFTYQFARCDNSKKDQEDAWFVRVEDSDESAYIALMKKVDVNQVEEILQGKKAYLKSRGWDRLADNCSLEDAGVFQVNKNSGGGFIQCRLTKKSFENGYSYKHPAFKALFYMVRNSFSNGNVKGARLYVEDVKSHPLPPIEDDLF